MDISTLGQVLWTVILSRQPLATGEDGQNGLFCLVQASWSLQQKPKSPTPIMSAGPPGV